MAKIYLETTFVSWLVARPTSNPVNAVKQAYTRKWWEENASTNELFASGFVVQEASAGDLEQAVKRGEFLRGLQILNGDIPEVRALAARLLNEHAVPKKETTDAFHIATAAVYGMDVLLTWNCKHMANIVTLPKTACVIANAGYQCPKIVTPKDLIEQEVPDEK